MADLKLNSAATSNLSSVLDDVAYDDAQPRSATSLSETQFTCLNFTTYFGQYKNSPECRAVTDTMTRWVMGDGFIATDPTTKVILDNITGQGRETFDEIIENLFKMAVIGGDGFAEIIRDESREEPDNLINLKILDPSSIRVIANRQGKIIRYEQFNKLTNEGNALQTFEPEQILHFQNGKVADEVMGTSQYESVQDIILGLKQVRDDMLTMVRRNIFPLRVIEIDSDDETKIDTFMKKYEKLIKNKEVLGVPKGTVQIITEGLSNNATFNPMPVLDYLRNLFYQSIGIPQILMGNGSEFSESSAKISYLAFERTIEAIQRYIISQIWNQLFMKIDLPFPASLKNELISDNNKDANAGTSFKPSDTTAGAGA